MIRFFLLTDLVVVGEDVPCHLVYPGLKLVTGFVAAPVPDHSEKRVLRQVFCQFAVHGHAGQEVEQTLIVPVKKLGCLLEVAVSYGFHDLLVCHQVPVFGQVSGLLPERVEMVTARN
jgi:hypothetical protein